MFDIFRRSKLKVYKLLAPDTFEVETSEVRSTFPYLVPYFLQEKRDLGIIGCMRQLRQLLRKPAWCGDLCL